MTTPTIRNEKRKLTANYLNGLGVGLFAVGGLSPLLSAIRQADATPAVVALIVIVCSAGSFGLHIGAHRILAGLEETDG